MKRKFHVAFLSSTVRKANSLLYELGLNRNNQKIVSTSRSRISYDYDLNVVLSDLTCRHFATRQARDLLNEGFSGTYINFMIPGAYSDLLSEESRSDSVKLYHNSKPSLKLAIEFL